MATILAAHVETELTTAARHVIAARLIVAQQYDRIARLKAQGSCTRDYERTLDIFLNTLQILEEHECALHASADKLAATRRPISR